MSYPVAVGHFDTKDLNGLCCPPLLFVVRPVFFYALYHLAYMIMVAA